MFTSMRKLFLSLLFAAVSLSLSATKVYYLNPSADLAAFVAGLKSVTDDNVTIYLSEGTYYLDKPLRFNVEHRVPISIEGRGHVVISGAESIKSWMVLPNGMWRTKEALGFNVQQLIVDGIIASKAKTPNEGVFYLQDGKMVSKEGNNVTYKALLPKEAERELKAISEMEKPTINLFRLFTHSKANVTSINTKENSITFTEPYTQSYFTPSRSTRVVLENYSAALDAPGEWYQDKDGFVYYIPREGEVINKTITSAARLMNLVSISGASNNLAGNITFKGLVFEGCDVTGSDKGIAPYQSAYTLDGALIAIYARNVNIINCEFRALGGYAVWMMNNCENCTITRNYIHDIGGGGIKIGGLILDENKVSKRIIVSNNIIERFGRIYMGATGVLLTYAQDCDILYNDIIDGYYTGISAGFSWGYRNTPTHDNRISFNKISNLGQGLLNDMAGIYTLGVSPGTVISNNVISDIKSSSGDGFGIYTDEGSSDILIEKNIAYNCTGGGFHQHYGSNNTVKNNIFAYGEKANLLISSVKKPEDIQLSFENNIVLVSKGEAISGGALENGRFVFKDNCFYHVNSQDLTVNGLPLESWMEDQNFSFQTDDPRLRNPEQGNFGFKSKRVARKIGFKTINTTQAGANWHPKTN